MSKSSHSKRSNASAPRTTGTTSRPLTTANGTTSKTTSRPITTANGTTSKTTSRPITTGTTASKTTSRPVSSGAATQAKRDSTAPRALRDSTAPRALRDSTAPRAGSTLKRKQAKATSWTRWRPIAITVGSLAVVIALFIWLSHNSNTTSGSGQLAPANVLSAVTGVSVNSINSVGTGGLTNPMQVTPANTPLIRGKNNLPVVFYNGGEFCPYCAAERWSMVIALSHFGTFSNLHLTTSSSTDVFPSTNTFTFYGSTYTSKYIDFQAVESYDGNQQTLQSMNSEQNTWFTTYDAPPYVPSASDAGGIPFLDFGNQYITISAGYSPSVINGLTWQQIATDLGNPSSNVAKNVIGNANYITAAICLLTNNQPSAVCQVPAITQIEKTLQALTKGK
jgi:hypothetical protein